MVKSMSTLTQNEREGLEEVFLSIKTSQTRYKKFKSFVSIWLTIHLQKAQNNATTGKFMDKLTKNFTFFSKDKKNLSK